MDVTRTSTQHPDAVNEKLLEQKIDKLMTSNNYEDGMNKDNEFYRELRNQPTEQDKFLAHMGENLAKMNPVLYPNADRAAQSLQVRFENQVYLEHQHLASGKG